ncbi:MAG TPA: PIG-L family deacetylase [Candidatus Limnocylindria bacterium]|nr:PIG-L family deacetylase [Candidatus Limnocylindria bacterium]
MSYRAPDLRGGLAAVLAHPDDETFACGGALALAHDTGAVTRLLVVTRGESGTLSGEPDDPLARTREEELICAARKIGLDEVSILDGYADGAVAEAPFDRLVEDVAAWLADRRPAAVVTFGSHGVTGHADHIVVGSATRWAVEQLAESGIAPNSVFVISPVFAPAAQRFDLSPEEAAPTHRIDITPVVGRKLAALECHRSQADAAEEIAALRTSLDERGTVYEGFTRVRPSVPPPHPVFDTRLL